MTFKAWLWLCAAVSGLWMIAVGAFGVLFVAGAYNTEPRPITVGVSVGALATFLVALVVPPASLFGVTAAAAWIRRGVPQRR